MQNKKTIIIIEYLSEYDRIQPAFKALKSKLEIFTTYKASNPEELLNILDNLNSTNESLIITILSHGSSNGILYDNKEYLVTWIELGCHANKVRTQKPIILNLIGICNSYLISDYRKTECSNIDKIWVSTDSVDSLDIAISAAMQDNFYFFTGLLDDSKGELYKEI